MAYLITNHDPFHIHKILGILVLMHMLHRILLIFRFGDAFPPERNEIVLSTAGVLAHGMLSWSSLLLPLPKKRNFKSPMIWPEFRLHSITFATRHVIATLLTLHRAWPTGRFSNFLAKLFLIAMTIQVASWVTKKYGSRELRTTNAMPYPKHVTKREQRMVKWNYATAQFGATSVILLDDVTMNWVPLLAIQLAPLLMTLVRKGKIGASTYHRVYSAALWFPFIAFWYRIGATDHIPSFFMNAVAGAPITWARITLRLPSLLLWTLRCAFVAGLSTAGIFGSFEQLARSMLLFAAVAVGMKRLYDFRVLLPLFLWKVTAAKESEIPTTPSTFDAKAAHEHRRVIE